MNQSVAAQTLKQPLPPALLIALDALFGARLSTTQAMREHHGRDESFHFGWKAPHECSH